MKPYEGDMRYLINTYIQADSAQEIGNLSHLSLTEAIIQVGIRDAIAQKLNQKGKLSKRAIAETIINNVRKTIVRKQLTDPKFYEEMSQLLHDLIQRKRDDVEAYERFLEQAEELIQKMHQKPKDNDVPTLLKGNPEAIILFNNLANIPRSTFQCPEDSQAKAELALQLDQAVRQNAPSGWKGDPVREKQVLNAIFSDNVSRSRSDPSYI
jgi:type I restriction enzyme R subunit